MGYFVDAPVWTTVLQAHFDQAHSSLNTQVALVRFAASIVRGCDADRFIQHAGRLCDTVAECALSLDVCLSMYDVIIHRK